MNLTAAGFVVVAMICDIGVWYLIKDLKIFDDELDGSKEIKEQRELEKWENLEIKLQFVLYVFLYYRFI